MSTITIAARIREFVSLPLIWLQMEISEPCA